jgi:hypothetical protein
MLKVESRKQKRTRPGLKDSRTQGLRDAGTASKTKQKLGKQKAESGTSLTTDEHRWTRIQTQSRKQKSEIDSQLSTINPQLLSGH